jgi:DNA mismatch endonuclease (patch repair protein)
MRSTRRRDTGPELAIRSLLHRQGLRYFVDRAIPAAGGRRRADLTFPRARVAVFIDGCFWHGCPMHASWPKQNAEWWRQKIRSNKLRDVDSNNALRAAGWVPIRVWEHEVPSVAAARISRIVTRRSAQP